MTFFESLKQYVGFTEASSAALRELHPLAQPSFVPIVDDFYAAIEAHPGARAAITGGPAQMARLKQTLIQWLDSMLLGPHDETYYQVRARIGRVHVRIELPQGFMFTAMNRIRVHLLDVLRGANGRRSGGSAGRSTALHQILDLELAIMLETYREDLVIEESQRRASRHHRPVRRRDRSRAPQSAGRDRVVAVPVAPAPGTGGRFPAPGRQAPRSDRRRSPPRQQDHSRSPRPGPQSTAAPPADAASPAGRERDRQAALFRRWFG